MHGSQEQASRRVYRKRRQKPSVKTTRVPLYLLSGVLLLVIWQLTVWLMSDSARRFLVPTPNAVVARFVKLARSGALAHHAGVTLLEMGLGLLLGTTVAVVLGYAVAHSRWIAYTVEPAIVISQAIPTIALAPLLTVWFGPGTMSKVVVCALIVFFPILVNVTSGLNSIDPRQKDLFRLLEASRPQILFRLEIPAALPAFLSGLKVSGTMAGMGAVVGEFVASTQGLGYLVKQGQNLYDLPMMFVAIFVLMALAILIYATLSLAERVLLRWQP
jgi:NitT/TauT family transport system permease protein